MREKVDIWGVEDKREWAWAWRGRGRVGTKGIILWRMIRAKEEQEATMFCSSLPSAEITQRLHRDDLLLSLDS